MVGTASSEEKCAIARGLGADRACHYNDLLEVVKACGDGTYGTLCQ